MSAALDGLAKQIGRLRGKGALAVLAGSFLTKIAAFLGSIVLVRVMSRGDYGILSYMENIYTYVYLFAGFGLSYSVLRYAVLSDTAEGKAGVVSFVLRKGTAINVALALVAAAASVFWPHSEGFAVARVLLPAMMLALPFQSAYDTFSYSLRALFRNVAYAVAAVVAIALVWSGKVIGSSVAGLVGASLAGLVSYAAMALGCGLYFRRAVFPGVRPAPVTRSDGRRYLSYGTQFMVTNGMWAMFLQNDLLLISLLTGDPGAVADYRVAYAVPSAISIISGSIGTFVVPYFIKHESDRGWVWGNYRRLLAVVCLSIGVICGGIALMGKPFVSFFYGDEYLGVVPLMGLLLVSSFLTNGVRFTTANLLSATGKVRSNMVIAFCGIAAQLVLDFLLIPRLGAYGAAVTSIIVYGGMAAAVVAVFVHEYRC